MLAELEDEIGYSFKKKNLLNLALTHSSYKNEMREKGLVLEGLDDNERLEFFGDTILSFVVTKEMYLLFDDSCEGRLSQYRADLVSRNTLFKIAKKIKLALYLNLGKGEALGSVKEKRGIMANAVEAIIAAIYFDGGMKNAEKFVLRYFGVYIDKRKLSRLNQNYKSALQEYSQRKYKQLPVYQTVMKKNSFVSTAYILKSYKALGKGANKRDAEQNAAQALLKKMKAMEKKKLS